MAQDKIETFVSNFAFILHDTNKKFFGRNFKYKYM